MRTTVTMLLPTLAVASLLLLAACGQRGALYFPGESREPAISPPAATEPAEDQDDD